MRSAVYSKKQYGPQDRSPELPKRSTVGQELVDPEQRYCVRPPAMNNVGMPELQAVKQSGPVFMCHLVCTWPNHP